MSVGAISPISSGSGVDLAQLAEMYQQQVAGMGPDSTTGVTANSGIGQVTTAPSADFASMIGEGLKRVEGLDITASTKPFRPPPVTSPTSTTT